MKRMSPALLSKAGCPQRGWLVSCWISAIGAESAISSVSVINSMGSANSSINRVPNGPVKWARMQMVSNACSPQAVSNPVQRTKGPIQSTGAWVEATLASK